MEQIKTEAIVIRSIKWSESSKIVTLFCRDLGLINVIAKGARKKNSRYQGILETLNSIEAVINISPNRELQILGNIELGSSFNRIRQDLHKMGYVLSILELINTFFSCSDTEPVFYDFLAYILNFIEANEKTEIAFWYFILKLTSYLGFRPEFYLCHECNNHINYDNLYFSYSNGSVICERCGSGEKTSGQLVKFLGILQGTKYKELNKITLHRISMKHITEFLLEYLRYHTDQNLQLSGLLLVHNSDNNK